MTGHRRLSEREETILHAVIHTYVTTAEAVGSRSIVKRYGLGVSAATVRNVMADLEERGYLEQLHTSSGRVPTDRGYRYYLNYLMPVQPPSPQEQEQIDGELSEMVRDAQEVIRHTSQLLALISHHPGIVEAPDDTNAVIRHIELAAITEWRLAMVVADNYGGVRTMLIVLDEPLPREVLEKLNQFLNELGQGVTFEQMGRAISRRLEVSQDEERRVAETAVRVLGLMPPHRSAQVFLEGTIQLFEQPEFHDVSKARAILTLLERREHFIEVLRGRLLTDEPPRFSVVLGSEMESEGMDEISVVASPYMVGGQIVGILGVVGPRRMPYWRLTPLVGYTAGSLSRLLTRLAG
ncbi:MAG: heat-inducible transcriptional repressor HrcA [Candidatus Hydrogenedentota bacterium]